MRNSQQTITDLNELKVIFKQGLTIQQLYQLVSPSSIALMNEQVWQGMMDFERLQDDWEKLFRFMKQAPPTLLSIRFEKRLSPHSIAGIRFTNLQILFMDKNNISNIESFTFFDMPNLKYITMDQNPIHNFHPLQKLKWEKLQQFSLTNLFDWNYNVKQKQTYWDFIEMRRLTKMQRMKINSQFVIDRRFNPFDYTVLVKFEQKKCVYEYMQVEEMQKLQQGQIQPRDRIQRINQQKVKQVIKKELFKGLSNTDQEFPQIQNF